MTTKPTRRASTTIMAATPTGPPSEAPAGFHLRALIREQLATSPDPNPHVIAALAAKLVPDDQLRAALDELMPDAVREEIRRQRADLPSGEPAEQPVSRKRRGAPAYRDWLRRPVSLDHAKADWRFLGDCTRDEVLRLAELAGEVAQKNLAMQARWERLADRMAKVGAATVADLPAEMLAEVLG